jgi:ABC-type antimicrobial peptide transport system permease subunit
MPGVTAAAWTSALPLTGETWVDAILRPGVAASPEERQTANYRFIGPEYFHAIGMPILQGRSIEPQDRTSTVTPAVINSRAARTIWPGEPAIGREFTRANPTQKFQVVGVVSDGRVTALESEPPLMVYVPYWFNNEGKSVLVVRSQGDAKTLVPSIRAIVREVDPDVAVAKVAPLTQLIDAAVENRRYQASLFTVFGAAALLIAIVGVYATTAYGVSRRRRELNIRVALGAQASQVFSMILRQSVTPLAAGLAGGLAGALALGGLVAGVLGIVAAVGILSAAAATLTGLEIEPAAALRED